MEDFQVMIYRVRKGKILPLNPQGHHMPIEVLMAEHSRSILTKRKVKALSVFGID
jgi:hypothetical protein